MAEKTTFFKSQVTSIAVKRKRVENTLPKDGISVFIMRFSPDAVCRQTICGSLGERGRRLGDNGTTSNPPIHQSNLRPNLRQTIGMRRPD